MTRRILVTLGEKTTETHCGDCDNLRRYPERRCDIWHGRMGCDDEGALRHNECIEAEALLGEETKR